MNAIYDNDKSVAYQLCADVQHRKVLHDGAKVAFFPPLQNKVKCVND